MVDVNQAVIITAPPRPGPEYAIEYMNQLNRWLENLARIVSGPSYLRGTGLYLVGLPTSGYGLKPGEVFADAGILTIVRPDDIWAGGFSVSTELGTLTVTV